MDPANRKRLNDCASDVNGSSKKPRASFESASDSDSASDCDVLSGDDEVIGQGEGDADVDLTKSPEDYRPVLNLIKRYAEHEMFVIAVKRHGERVHVKTFESAVLPSDKRLGTWLLATNAVDEKLLNKVVRLYRGEHLRLSLSFPSHSACMCAAENWDELEALRLKAASGGAVQRSQGGKLLVPSYAIACCVLTDVFSVSGTQSRARTSTILTYTRAQCEIPTGVSQFTMCSCVCCAEMSFSIALARCLESASEERWCHLLFS